ncbi:M20 family metallopeptidase [Candidatus Uhrbacteria bacterium]|nr:M20 family metallopeptidase [Candidatus Uhrbacteria bacterium]
MIEKVEVIALTEKLIRFHSTKNNPEELHACADFLETYFADSGFEIQRFEQNGIPSIMVTEFGVKKPKVLLNGHFDVVEGDDEQFVPKQEEDKIFGRGALDMKSGLAIMMMLMRQAKEKKWDLGLMMVGDEEVGGFNGTGYLTKLGFGGEIVIIPDGGSAVHRIIEKEKGVLRLVMHAKGESAHGSVPWKGKNAIQLLASAITLVQDAFTPLEKHPEDHWVTTCNIGLIEGGVAANQVAASAKAVCDIRFVEKDTPEKIIERMQKIMPEGIEIEHVMTVPPMTTSSTHPNVALFAEFISACGRTAEYSVAHGSSDGRFFSQQGSNVIICQPDGANHHGRNEWVSIPSMMLYAEVLEKYVTSIAKKS